MPVSGSRRVAGLVRGLRAALSPGAFRKSRETAAELAEARRQLARKNREMNRMRRELARLRGSTFPDTAGKPPVFFVVGYQKSGTTWLMKMLDAHPEIMCHGEGRFFGREWVHEKLKEMPVKQQPSSLYYAVEHAEDLRYWVERSPWSRQEDPEEHLANLTRGTIDYFLARRLAGSGKRLVGDKSPLLTPRDLEDIVRIYPEAKVIHIIRDGRDVAVSGMHHIWNFGKGETDPKIREKRDAYRSGGVPPKEGQGIFTGKILTKLAREWNERVGGAVRAGAALGPHYTEVHYEELLERPEEAMERLVGFLGADTAPQAVRRCVEAASFEQLSGGRRRGEEEATSFFRKGVAGDWRNVFTAENRRTFKKHAGELLVRLGYERDEDW
jgi:hypothetical protein